MNAPEILYKYRQWDDYGKKMLQDREIYFTSPAKFNDPFDTTVRQRYDLCSSKQIKEIMTKRLKQDEPYLNREERRKKSRIQEKEGFYKNVNNINNVEKWEEEYKNKNFGIFSMSSNKDNLLMWSHYSKSHTGYCVGFSTDRLLEFFEYYFISYGNPFQLLEVEYHREYPLIDPYSFKNEPDGGYLWKFRIKSVDWRYEQEFRLILFNETNIEVKLNAGIIREVIMGCKMSKASVDEIRTILKNQNDDIKLYQARKCKDKFALEFEEVDYK